MIKRYQQFIKENTYQVDKNDPPEIASDKNSLNQTQSNIEEFLAKKTIVDNIYATYKDQNDLVKKLIAQKLILNTNDSKKIQFTNALLGLYAQSAEKKRSIKNLEDELKNQKETISNKQLMITQNPETRESAQKDIDYSTGRINDITKQISDLNTQIANLQKSTQKQLDTIKSGIKDSTDRINSPANITKP